MVEYSLWRVQVWVFLGFWHWAGKVRYEVVRGHLLEVDVAIGDHANLRHALIGCVLVGSMLHVSAEFVFGQVPQHTRQSHTLESTNARDRSLIVLDEALQVFNGLRALGILDEIAHLLLLDLRD